MTNLDSILKSRDITLPTKVHIVKAMVFPVVMYGCESWTIRKAERQRIDAFVLWCWRTLLRVPWTVRRSNQSKGNQLWIFIGGTDAEAPILKAIWCEELTHWKRPYAGKDWRQEKGNIAFLKITPQNVWFRPVNSKLELNIPLSFHIFCERKKIDFFFKAAIFSVLF